MSMGANNDPIFVLELEAADRKINQLMAKCAGLIPTEGCGINGDAAEDLILARYRNKELEQEILRLREEMRATSCRQLNRIAELTQENRFLRGKVSTLGADKLELKDKLKRRK